MDENVHIGLYAELVIALASDGLSVLFHHYGSSSCLALIFTLRVSSNTQATLEQSPIQVLIELNVA